MGNTSPDVALPNLSRRDDVKNSSLQTAPPPPPTNPPQAARQYLDREDDYYWDNSQLRKKRETGTERDIIEEVLESIGGEKQRRRFYKALIGVEKKINETANDLSGPVDAKRETSVNMEMTPK